MFNPPGNFLLLRNKVRGTECQLQRLSTLSEATHWDRRGKCHASILCPRGRLHGGPVRL